MFILYDENMNKINLPTGVTPLDIFISSISKERVTGSVEGCHRRVDYGFTYNERDVELRMLMQSADTKDYRLLRDAVYALFHTGDKFYVSESYQPGKRLLISVDDKYIPERIPNNRIYAEAIITCTKQGIPFSESIGTTQDIQTNGLSSDDELWGFGMGLYAQNNTHVYSFNALPDEVFRVFNASNVDVHPFEQDFKLTLKNIKGSTERVQLRNQTNQSFTRINIAPNENDVIAYDGPNVTRNGLSFLRDTNKEYIWLSPGWNHFQIYYCDSADIEFDFRFYYL